MKVGLYASVFLDFGVLMLIFSTWQRHDPRPMSRQESRFKFLDRVSSAYWDRVRSLVEDWVAAYPSGPDRSDLIQRMCSIDDDKQAAAFWELYLHESLRRDGWAITPHPSVSTSRRRPDFVARRGTDAIVLEATTIGHDVCEIKEQKRVQQILDGLEGLDSPDFYLSVDYKQIGPDSPPIGELWKRLNKWLSQLDVAEVRTADARYGWQGWPTLSLRPGFGWHLVFRAVPVREGVHRQLGTNVIGMEGPGEAIMVDHIGPLVRHLDEKAGAYGKLTAPYVIALLDLSEYPPSEEDLSSALYGRSTGWLNSDGQVDRIPFRARDGFWSRGRASAGSVSAVLTMWGMRPWTVASDRPLLWRSPTDAPAVPLLPWPLEHLAANGLDVVQELDDYDPRTFFNLSDDWPGPEAPFRYRS